LEIAMQILRTLAAATFVFSQSFQQPPRITRSDPVLVLGVLDGDTITVSAVGRVRLLGIDAPEVSHGLDTAAPFGREARDRLSGLLWHRWVRLEMEGPSLDAYNRHLAYVVTDDGQCVNTILVREGLARVSARTPLARLDELRRAEAAAQSSRRGMWGSAPPPGSTGYTRVSGRKRASAAAPDSSSKRSRNKQSGAKKTGATKSVAKKK
jgi:endonuclease YncB( thermonuclease family)